MTSSATRLAIEGGAPVRTAVLPYARQVLDDDDIARVVAVLKSDWLTTGPAVEEFEQAFAVTVGARHAVAIANGTAALHAAAAAAGLGPNHEVIVPAMTFAASANCARYVGANVRFADVRTDTLCLDVGATERGLTARTRAIVAVDFAGQPCDWDDLRNLANRRGLVLIADAAHALGATYHGKPVGTLASLTTFSFHPVKHVTTAEGGIVTTEDDALAERLRRFRNHGIARDHRRREREASWLYDIDVLGYNYRLSDLQCALGTSQLRKLAGWLSRREAIAHRYAALLLDEEALELPTVAPDRRHAWHLFVVRLRGERLTVDRMQVFKALRAENIGVNVHYIPVHLHPYYRENFGYKGGEFPVAESAYERLISLPMFHAMSGQDVKDVTSAVTKVVSSYSR